MPPSQRLGSYELLSELGRGANGVVFRAVDRRLKREVALKVLPPSSDQTETDAFRREARATARLRHPGIVVVYDAEIIDGARVVALELVEGGSLQQKLKQDGPLPPRDAARIVAELAAAVHSAHVLGIVHRDMKPANVLLEKDGRARLTDFGLARDERGKMLSRTGEVVGTPAYMAPEQAKGETDRVGPWTDVYGLGAVLYECLSGSPPFWGKDVMTVLEMVIRERPRPIDTVRAGRGLEPLSPDLATICAKALEKERDQRYTTAAALEEDLKRWLDGRPIKSRPKEKAPSALGTIARRAPLVALGLLGVAAVAGLAVVPGTLERSRRRERCAHIVANVGTGEGKFLREKAVFELLNEPADVTVPLLVETLERTTARMNALAREKLLAVAEPANQEERTRQIRFERLREALDRLDVARPDERISRPLVRSIEEARRRYALRGSRSGLTAGVLLAAEQRLLLGEGELNGALVALEVLGRTGRAQAVDAIGRHLHAAEDEERGTIAAQALGRLKDGRAARSILRVDERHARGGSFENRAIHAFAHELGGVLPAFETKTALDFLDRARLRGLIDDRAGALDDLNRAVSLDPKDPFVWSARASILMNKKDWPAASHDLERAMALEPDVAGHLASHAWTLSHRKELDRALAECDKAVELDPANAHSWSSRGLVKVKKNDRAGALADLSRAIELDKGLASPWASRASLRLEEDDIQGAIDDDTRSLELDPNSATVWNNRACAKQRKGDLDGALADYARAIELAPLDEQQYVNRANCHVARHDHASAIADITKALELEPRDGRALAIRGRAKLYTKDTTGAEADLKRAVELAPGDAAVWNALSFFHLTRGDTKSALEAVERQVEVAPDNADALTSRGFIRMKVGDLQGAREDCVKATELRPLDATCWDNLAEVLLHAKDHKAALEASERCLRLGHRSAASWRRSATLKHWLKDLQGALADATRAVEINSHDFANLFVRADIYVALGDRDAALKDYKAALALFGPKDEDPKIIRERIALIESQR